MRAGTRHHAQARRGVVLVLVLGMLGLLALIGVTFATFSGQAVINARNYAQSVVRPQDDELMDFALQQLVTDTNDPRSVIRGHSLARDMYGNDALANGYVAAHPALGTLYLTAITANGGGSYSVTTNIASNDAYFYGYNFTRWIMRVGYSGNLATQKVNLPLTSDPAGETVETLTVAAASPANQTFEILADSGFNAGLTTGRVFTIAILDPNPADVTAASNLLNATSNPNGGQSTNLVNWGSLQPGGATAPTASQLPSLYLLNKGSGFPFVLDGRWLHAFNGPGLGTQYFTPTLNDPDSNAGVSGLTINVPYSAYGNFRYNGLNPNTVGMDEDYDACDLENWFLAIQSADGQVMIPSFHRPGIVRYHSSAVVGGATPNKYDWDPVFRQSNWVDSASRILRPVAADGHDSTTFHDLVPDPNTGKITYDVDNDGDGATDSVWLDLGYPARRDSSGNLYKPLFAFMVIGLNGRIPLNTAGNLAGRINPLASTGDSTPSNYIAGAGPTHSSHLGNSVSEIDPTYGLQNAYDPTIDTDPFNQVLSGTVPGAGGVWDGPNGPNVTYNTQVDNAINGVSGSNNAGTYQPVDVRLTQLRNLLAGTRPQTTPTTASNVSAAVNGDTNLVYGSWPGTLAGKPYVLPNGIADAKDLPTGNDTYNFTDPNGTKGPLSLSLVQSISEPVEGRWGEKYAVPGIPFTNPNSAPTAPRPRLNLIQLAHSNPVRAGFSFNASDMLNYFNNGVVFYDTNGDIVFPMDAADDNYNAFDVYPTRSTGEVGDADFYDALGGLLLPVERMRRFVTPIDINGTGRVQTWNSNKDYGPDNLGRVQFSSYFRPAGVAGAINTYPGSYSGTAGTLPYGGIAYGNWATDTPTGWSAGAAYVPDVTNNPLHGYEWYKLPNQNQIAGPSGTTAAPSYNTVKLGGMPVLPAADGTTPPPTTYGTYNNTINSGQRLDGVNEADEMNLYANVAVLDSPYDASDLEWLYRQQDVDGAPMTSRLASLAPISFTNTIDGLRRRRLYALDSWEMNNFAWTNDNPVSPASAPAGAFANNSRFAIGQNASYYQTSLNTGSVYATPALAHRDKKINLNYPLPVSNDPNEPIRQKWISETYQLLKVVLPPTSVDSAEELAQLSQFVINIIDFRDPDATMTHWVNPDVWITPGSQQTSGGSTYYTYPVLTIGQPTVPSGTTNASYALEQYGMEYNPVAINEVLAYGFQTRRGTAISTASYTNRVFVELVNTLTAAYNPTFNYTKPDDNNNYYGYGTSNTGGNTASSTAPPQQASTLDLGGFSYTANDPYGGGCWDLVFTADDAMSRPDPYRGDLLYNPNLPSGKVTTYGLVPLNRDSVAPTFTAGSSSAGASGGADSGAPNGGDVTLMPLSPNASNVTGGTGSGNPLYNGPTTQPATGPPLNYFYVVGSLPNTSTSGPTTTSYEYNPIGTTGGSSTQYPCVSQYLIPGFDPMNTTTSTAPPVQYRAGVLPAPSSTTNFTGVPGFQWKLPTFSAPSGSSSGSGPAVGSAQYYWVCLRRPANPFAPVSAANPMVVVDSMRFPYIDGTANAGMNWSYVSGSSPPVTPGPASSTSGTLPNTIYSAQRLQPYRGGHAVPMPSTISNPTNPTPPDPRYGYSEQIAVPQTFSRSAPGGNGATFGLANPMTDSSATLYPSTNYIYHTLGYNNDSAENWDYFVFNDRDFSSVAELLLVPGCPPGLFTKQFVEFANSQMNAADIFVQVRPMVNPAYPANFAGGSYSSGSSSFAAAGTGSLPGPFATATVPFLDVSQATIGSTIGSKGGISGSLPQTVPAFPTSGTYGLAAPYNQPTSGIVGPVQPHTFPYLVDRFFYTGASSFYYTPGGTALDPGSPNSSNQVAVVGGPGGDGWFKMFEFFEVPSQSNGAIGPVAQGVNFDWARQDKRPGLMNLNLIVDEEAFFAVFGQQSASGYNASSSDSAFNQILLNSIELPLLTSPAATTTTGLPYVLPLATGNKSTPPIPLGGPPVPLVVSAIQPGGAPNFVYPITDQTQLRLHGYLAGDPILTALGTAAGVGNRLKAAFAQFLWARHGGSGYLFAHGVGSTGNNSAVALNGTQVNSGAVPAEFPFHSLSYPDINYTIMRPAAMPPSGTSNPPAVNAALLMTTQTASTGSPYFQSTTYYSPFVTTNANAAFASNVPIVFSGDPGVRSPFFNAGYVTGAVVNPYSASTLSGTYPYSMFTPSTASSFAAPVIGVPPGVPVPLNVAFPAPAMGTPPTASVMMPPPIPPARLFQVPDYFGAGQMQPTALNYRGLWQNSSTTYGSIPPAVSHATDSGDPWINNFVANQLLQTPYATATDPLSYTMTSYPPSYTLNNGFMSLPWSGGTYYSSASAAPPLLTATGVLPPVSLNYNPYFGMTATGTSLGLYNGYYQTAPTDLTSPYLGSRSPSGTVVNADDRQHPYWRTELIQKAMNLTTVRTHQYAVWITIGFFEVIRQGDVGMLYQGAPQLAFDLIGPEIGALNGSNVRYRGFFLVDRLKLTGFHPGAVDAFHSAIVYRKVIQ